MKKLFTAIILISLTSLLWASDETWTLNTSASNTKIITAYKQGLTQNDVPELSISIRLLDYSSNEFSAGSSIEIPIANRNSYYGAFSWIMAGNAFENVNLKFSFGCLLLNGASEPAIDEQVVNGETVKTANYIPYEVCPVYDNSRIENSVIQINTPSTASTYSTNSYAGEEYRFYYADNISGAYSETGGANTSTSITTDAADSENPQVTITYNMSTQTGVQNAAGTKGKTDYINAVTASYTDENDQTQHINQGNAVCNYWNRMGTMYVKLGIDQNATWTSDDTIGLESGRYNATVIVEVSL